MNPYIEAYNRDMATLTEKSKAKAAKLAEIRKESLLRDRVDFTDAALEMLASMRPAKGPMPEKTRPNIPRVLASIDYVEMEIELMAGAS